MFPPLSQQPTQKHAGTSLGRKDKSAFESLIKRERERTEAIESAQL